MVAESQSAELRHHLAWLNASATRDGLCPRRVGLNPRQSTSLKMARSRVLSRLFLANPGAKSSSLPQNKDELFKVEPGDQCTPAPVDADVTAALTVLAAAKVNE